jgi:DNA/RNA endonuclease G (NUC1)
MKDWQCLCNHHFIRVNDEIGRLGKISRENLQQTQSGAIGRRTGWRQYKLRQYFMGSKVG